MMNCRPNRLFIFLHTVLFFFCFCQVIAKKTATIKIHGLQVEMSDAVSNDGEIIYFTSYDGRSSTPRYDNGSRGPLLSGELKPLSFGSSTFVTDYGTVNSWGEISEYGEVSLSMPSTDSDANGISDWLQIDKDVNERVNGSSELHYIESGSYSGNSTITGTFTRTSGSNEGNYNLTFSISGLGSFTVSGNWYIEYQSGTMEYDDTSYSINVSTKNSYGITEQSTGSSDYSIIDQDNLKLGEISMNSPDGTVQFKETSLKKSGNSYVGSFQAIDGYPSTSWADYIDYYIEITDTNDGNEDGIPDLTDPVEPLLSTAGTDLGLGWRSLDWFGVYFPYSSGWYFHLDHNWIYSITESLDSIWYWHETHKWCWTNQTAYPWVWFHDEQNWKYYIKQTDQWVAPVTSTESDSQNQNSNNSNDNSSGSNSGSSFDSNNPPKTWTVSSAYDLEMIWVEPGTFTMGSPTTESGRSSSETEHQVTLSQGFYLGKYEVTQAQYEAVMTGNSDGLSATPSYFSSNPNRPVEQVSWDDIQVFLTRLNQSDSTNIPTGWAYVLPTEAQWEYTCRAGTTTAYSWGDSISSTDANYAPNGYGSGIQQTSDVGSYSPNAWGFYDMHGNVREWVADWYGSYDSNAVTDPTGPASGSRRVHRGGSWDGDGTLLRSAKRNSLTPSGRDVIIGFRVGFQKVQ